MKLHSEADSHANSFKTPPIKSL